MMQHQTNTVLERILRQRVEALVRYLDDPYLLKEKLDELNWFVERKMQA
jgi:hypothetical protein